MKFKITMKDPDGVYDSVQVAVKESVNALDLSDSEKDAVLETRLGFVTGAISKWFEYGEYLTVEVDTEAMTATVCEQ